MCGLCEIYGGNAVAGCISSANTEESGLHGDILPLKINDVVDVGTSGDAITCFCKKSATYFSCGRETNNRYVEKWMH